jgi:hypothetical protein
MTKHLPLPSKHTTRKIGVVYFLLMMFLLPKGCLAANYDYTYELLDNPEGSTVYRLTVSVTSSLYEYYSSQDHNIMGVDDLAKFVTPTALKPVAIDLWSIYSDDEDFVNGALMIVHQIPYEESVPQKYPVETIVENEGDCDLFSFIAASIMTAGGLDVVLLLYETQNHMALGVNLSHEPYDARSDVYYYTYNEKQYYVAECTGSDWRNGWRIGELPDMLNGAPARVITLEDSEQSSSGQVFSSFMTITPSSVYLAVSTKFVFTGSTVTISGSISPVLSGKNVTLYVSSNGSPFRVLATVTTDSNGKYLHMWHSSSGGTHLVRASWYGDDVYTGADSTIQTLIVVPLEWLMMGGMIIFSLSILLVVTWAMRTKPLEESESYGELKSLTIQNIFESQI